MKSKVKGITYLLPFLMMAFFIFVFLEMTMDNTIVIYSLQWWIFLIIILGIFSMFIFSLKKIPKIEIINNEIYYNSNGTLVKIKIGEITKIERVTSMINGWYSFRGGLNIIAENENLIFPFHIYTNETEILQQIYKSDKEEIKPISNYSIENVSFIKYFYRNIYSFFIIPIVGFIFILQSKDENTILGIIVISLIIALLMAVILRTFKYLKLDNEYLYSINPIGMKSCKYELKSIKHVNSKVISTGRGVIKNLTIELVNKQIVTLNAGLNKQNTLDEIERKLNTRSNM